MMKFFFVGLGGALGAIARVALAAALPPFILSIPFTILCINVLGCFAIGIITEIMALYWNASMHAKHFLIQGFLGGFTTFSAFSLECGLLYKEGFYATAVIYAALSVSLGVLFFFLGLKLIRIF